MSDEIDFEQYVLKGKGAPLMLSMIKSIEESFSPHYYPISSNYNSFVEVLGDFDEIVTFTDSTPGISFFSMEPWYNPDKEKFIISKYNDYDIFSDKKDRQEPETYTLRLGDEYIVIFLNCGYSGHEYLFLKDEDGNWATTRQPYHIKKAADIGSTAIALSDKQAGIVTELPF